MGPETAAIMGKRRIIVLYGVIPVETTVSFFPDECFSIDLGIEAHSYELFHVHSRLRKTLGLSEFFPVECFSISLGIEAHSGE